MGPSLPFIKLFYCDESNDAEGELNKEVTMSEVETSERPLPLPIHGVEISVFTGNGPAELSLMDVLFEKQLIRKFCLSCYLPGAVL